MTWLYKVKFKVAYNMYRYLWEPVSCSQGMRHYIFENEFCHPVGSLCVTTANSVFIFAVDYSNSGCILNHIRALNTEKLHEKGLGKTSINCFLVSLLALVQR